MFCKERQPELKLMQNHGHLHYQVAEENLYVRLCSYNVI